MDHLIFLAQDKVESWQIILSSYSSEVTSLITKLTIVLQKIVTTTVQCIEKNEIGANIIKKGGTMLHLLKAVKPKEIYQDLIFILYCRENRLYIYVGGICFLIGGTFGIYIGTKRSFGVVAPQRMRAVVVNNYKGYENITVLEDMMAPKISKTTEVLVQVKAAGIDYLDIKVSEGYGHVLRKHLNKYNRNVDGEFPVVLGRDCSGIVVSVGCDVTRVHPGDEVWLAVPIYHPGTLSEYIVVNESLIAIKPEHVTHEAIAALPFSVMTAWDALVNQAGLGPNSSMDKRILIHAGVSGVGVVALQMARAWGAHVTTTVSTRAAPLAQMLGANDIISYDASNFKKELHLREKFDVILNTVGPVLIESCLKHCAPGGVVVTTTLPILSSDSFGYFRGTIYSLLIKIQYMFSLMPWSSGTTFSNIEISGEVLDKVTPMITSGQIQPIVDKAYSAQDAEVAFSHVAKGDQIGKTVIRFRSRPLSSMRDSPC